MDKPKYKVGDTVIFDHNVHFPMSSEEKVILSKPCHIMDVTHMTEGYFYRLGELCNNIWFSEHCLCPLNPNNLNKSNNLLNWLYTERSE